jgi:MYXO-CTERM domain-containing protein
MRGLASSVSAVFFASSALLSAGASAQSCPCGPKADVQSALHASVAVFEGHVHDVRFLKSDPPYVEAQMRVVRAWKGMNAEQATVLSPPIGTDESAHASCTYAFEPGESYLVYATARGEDGRYAVTMCSRTRAVDEAQDDLMALGMGSAPVSPQKPGAPAANDPSAHASANAAEAAPISVRAERAGCASCSVGTQRKNENAALPALVVLGLAALRLRKRRD